jgi:hypothetical protein
VLETCRDVSVSNTFGTCTKRADPLTCTSLVSALITPTRVQFSKGPEKYETPLFRTSASIWRSAHAEMACENNVAQMRRSTLGRVELARSLAH